jgi:CoA-transferase family III
MQKPMTGVGVLEVAQFTFVPSAGAVLADWGADVIKIENRVTGYAQRGLVTVAGRSATTRGVSFSPMIEAPNCGKRSVGLSQALKQIRPVFEELVGHSDVFLTDLLPQARAKLRINLDEIRRINPEIVYVAGSGFGNEGPHRETGAHDATAFWARAGKSLIANGRIADVRDAHGNEHRLVANPVKFDEAAAHPTRASKSGRAHRRRNAGAGHRRPRPDRTEDRRCHDLSVGQVDTIDGGGVNPGFANAVAIPLPMGPASSNSVATPVAIPAWL